ncbi:MAG: FKBP-type peptidyl-prolyl cis-trans isomerase [Lachnospiraceae bacterium]|nr:FKBP-type peptidyl-prolyl cis-trans isomerase [Lachnospiraceae bacterium]
MGKNKDDNSADNLSNSMKKRIDRASQQKKAKRTEITGRIISILILALIAAGVIALIAAAVVKASNKVTPNNNYSEGLDENGYIKGVTASSIITMPEYKGVSISKSDIEPTDTDIANEIERQRKQHLDTETDKKIENGDIINLDYVGTIDGVEFEGGNTNGSGSDLTIGSGTFIDDFEKQLIGAGVGDNVTVNVTFPDDYNKEDLQGKDAVFECTINGIYPEFTDEFVAEYLSDNADTVEGYKEFYRDQEYDKNLDNWIDNYLDENTTVSKYPYRYLKQLKALQKYTSLESFQYMNQIYEQMYGSGYSDFYEYNGTTEEEYDKELINICQDSAKKMLIYQAIMEKEGIRCTVDDYKAYLVETEGSDDSYEQQKETFGDPYLIQSVYKSRAYKIIKDNAVYTD